MSKFLPLDLLDKKGSPFLLKQVPPRDARLWIEHMARVSKETPWMLQSEHDPLPEFQEAKVLLRSYEKREGSLVLGAYYPGQWLQRRELAGVLMLGTSPFYRSQHVAELSMGVLQAYWGRGLGKALLGKALEWVEEEGTVHRVGLSVFTDNERAIRLYERFGFLREGILERYVKFQEDGTYQDLLAMGKWIH